MSPPLETPRWNATYAEEDAWLIDRGWVREDRATWRLMTGRRVVIATHGEAVKTQRRRDAATKGRR